MIAWCQIQNETKVTPGLFLEASIVGVSGAKFQIDPFFLDELARRIMATYEGQQVGELTAIEAPPLERPERTRRFYRRLFSGTGQPTAEFETWASENLAAWVEESFEPTVGLLMNEPHHNDPAYDVLAAFEDKQVRINVRVVQVKSTHHNLAVNCNAALNKFRLLEEGQYDAELKSKLMLMKKVGQLPPQTDVNEIMFDLKRRFYRVTAFHNEDRNAVEMLTTYDEKIPGDSARRSVRLMRLDGWDEFWASLAQVVYARLT